jgi:hypothetical protein
MHVSVEPSGCCENNGLVQVRLCMYLDVGDYGYERHSVEGGVNPFHNHFIFVSPDATDTDIMDQAEAFARVAFEKWKADHPIIINNKRPEFGKFSKSKCNARVKKLKNSKPRREVKHGRD